MTEPLRPLNKTDWPAGYKEAPTVPRPVTIDNAILFGFKFGIGLTLWSLVLGFVCLVFFLLLAFLGIGTRIH